MSKTHILAIPFPLQGHISPMIQLCKRLAYLDESIRITLVLTSSSGSNLNISQSTNNDAHISIETVPDVAVEGIDSLDMYEVFFRVFEASVRSGVRAIVERCGNDDEGSSGFRLKAILYDSVMPWVRDLARENGLKGAALFTQACSVNSIFYHIQKGSYEIPPEGADAPIELPAMPLLKARDLPSLVVEVGPYEAILRALVGQFSADADWNMCNTFDKLEDEMLKWMEKNQHKILTVGPTVPSMYTDKRIQGNYEYGLTLFKPQDDDGGHGGQPSASHVKEWLDSKPDESVIYVSFGSIVTFGEKQIEELLHGLIEAEYSFLWAARGEASKVPRGSFSPEKGLVVSWCDQLQVLSHKAVGCFVTHCGWNSTLESMVSGLPMVAMPQWADQATNAKFVADVWRVGFRAQCDGEGVVTREEVSTCVRDVMSSGELRRNVSRLKEMAIEAVSEGGSSDRNVAGFVEELANL